MKESPAGNEIPDLFLRTDAEEAVLAVDLLDVVDGSLALTQGWASESMNGQLRRRAEGIAFRASPTPARCDSHQGYAHGTTGDPSTAP